MISIEIARRHYLLYLLLPHWAKVALLSPGSRARLDRINLAFNDTLYSGEGADDYDRIHAYGTEQQHEYPAHALVESVWAPEGYGRALELGAGSGYFTTAIARRAQSVVAVEPVADMRAVIDKRCRDAGLSNVTTLAGTAFDLADRVPDAAIDSALVLQSLHHFHRRPEVFAALGRVVRPGGRLYLVEPHHRAQLGHPRLPHAGRAAHALPARRLRRRAHHRLLDSVLPAARARAPASLRRRAPPRPAAARAAPRRRPRGRSPPRRGSRAVTAPRVSVLLAVHDGAPWVKDAVASVLAQTLADLELVVVDDGSADATPALLAGIADRRLRVERRPRAGLTRALNLALGLARAPIVARLDADDVALPERLARQVAFLDAHPEIGVLGSAAREVNGEGREVRVVRPPEDDAALRRALIRRNPMVHSTVTMRRLAVEGVGGYDARFAVAQDYDLWMRLAAVTRLANLPDALVVRRLLPGRVSVARDADRLRAEARARWRAVRAGAYPPWCLVFVARPLLALAVPGPWRRALRRSRG